MAYAPQRHTPPNGIRPDRTITITQYLPSIAQNYILHNRAEPGREIPGDRFPGRAIVPLSNLPRGVDAIARVEQAAELLF
jgi:hypothetical protein